MDKDSLFASLDSFWSTWRVFLIAWGFFMFLALCWFLWDVYLDDEDSEDFTQEEHQSEEKTFPENE